MNDLDTNHNLELNISRLVDLPPEKLYRCWTEPKLLMQWFTPAPWKTVECEIDLRVGGAFNTRMQGPNGEDVPNRGVYLEIVPDRKLVFTDAFQSGWLPSGKPFAVLTITFEKEGSQTRYSGRVRHWTEADYQDHLDMGFHQGWHTALDQLIDVAKKL